MKNKFKLGKYEITGLFSIIDWSWKLLPCINVSFDEVGVYWSFGFLCFGANVDIENIEKAKAWEEKLDKILKTDKDD